MRGCISGAKEKAHKGEGKLLIFVLSIYSSVVEISASAFSEVNEASSSSIDGARPSTSRDNEAGRLLDLPERSRDLYSELINTLGVVTRSRKRSAESIARDEMSSERKRLQNTRLRKPGFPLTATQRQRASKSKSKKKVTVRHEQMAQKLGADANAFWSNTLLSRTMNSHGDSRTILIIKWAAALHRQLLTLVAPRKGTEQVREEWKSVARDFIQVRKQMLQTLRASQAFCTWEKSLRGGLLWEYYVWACDLDPIMSTSSHEEVKAATEVFTSNRIIQLFFDIFIFALYLDSTKGIQSHNCQSAIRSLKCALSSQSDTAQDSFPPEELASEGHSSKKRGLMVFPDNLSSQLLSQLRRIHRQWSQTHPADAELLQGISLEVGGSSEHQNVEKLLSKLMSGRVADEAHILHLLKCLIDGNIEHEEKFDGPDNPSPVWIVHHFLKRRLDGLTVKSLSEYMEGADQRSSVAEMLHPAFDLLRDAAKLRVMMETINPGRATIEKLKSRLSAHFGSYCRNIRQSQIYQRQTDHSPHELHELLFVIATYALACANKHLASGDSCVKPISDCEQAMGKFCTYLQDCFTHSKARIMTKDERHECRHMLGFN